MTVTTSASFRDPENAAFAREGIWYRIAEPASARALRTLRASATYERLVSKGAILAFDEVADGAARLIKMAYAATGVREPSSEAVVFRVEEVDLITYPWEWPNSLLQTAARLTLEIRRELLALDLDLKDASALNVQFRGMTPVFIDLGSIEVWRPNPSWNAARQFIEHFVNPLAVGSGAKVTAADAWALGHQRGLRSDVARTLLAGSLRRSPGLALLQASTKPVEHNDPTETKFAAQANANPQLAKNATLSLTKRLAKQIDKLTSDAHSTTWVDYGSRAHYGAEDLDRKSAFVTAFVTAEEGRNRLVLDVGGNDGFTAAHLVRQAGARVIVMDRDAGALDVLHKGAGNDAALAAGITPLIGDLTALTPASGLLGREFAGFLGRVTPSAVTCQAVLHHVVITQGVPMAMAIEALAAFGAPVQIEFATEDDEKSRILLSQIPNWTGEYSTEALLAALRDQFERVEVVGNTSATRIVVNAEGPRA